MLSTLKHRCNHFLPALSGMVPCLYAGSSQGGSITNVEPIDSVIEGNYLEYKVDLFGSYLISTD